MSYVTRDLSGTRNFLTKIQIGFSTKTFLFHVEADNIILVLNPFYQKCLYLSSLLMETTMTCQKLSCQDSNLQPQDYMQSALTLSLDHAASLKMLY